MNYLFAYLQCHRIRGVGLNDVNIFPADFIGNLGFDGCFVTDKAKDSVAWILRELAEEFELNNELLITHSCKYSKKKSLHQGHARLR